MIPTLGGLFAAWMMLAEHRSVVDPFDPRVRPSYYVTASLGQSQLILGSQEVREHFLISIAHGKPEPHFSSKHIPVQLIKEFYFQKSHTSGGRQSRITETEALGFLATARFRWPMHRFGAFADFGFGVQIADFETHDLSTKVNTTPSIGFGLAIGGERDETLLGFRLLHISNGGLRPPNYGQNQIYFFVSTRF